MLEAARRRLEIYDNIEFVEADLRDLPLEAKSLDAVILMLVLHHQENPEAIVAEAARVLRSDGRLMIVDMVAHDRIEFRDEMGHVHMGFEEKTVHGWGKSCSMHLQGFRRLRASVAGQGPGLFTALLST
jgi:ArsR family transcriptional regulator